MALYGPDYYKDFKCVASACHHSCCIGWQVAVDEESLYRYRVQKGDIGVRLTKAIEEKNGRAFFRLSENKRCPFLNENGLCDIICTLGAEHLTQICADHPRFRSFLPSRTEIGLGICCEEAARLILTRTEKMVLVCLEGEEKSPRRFEKRLLKERAALLAIAQDRTLPFSLRIQKISAYAKRPRALLNNAPWIPLYRSLERLDGAFDTYLDLWEEKPNEALEDFALMAEQLLVYFIFRHLARAKNMRSLRARAAFCALASHHVLSIAAARGGSLDDFLDTARLYSSEIEYSEENTARIIKACAARSS